MIRTFSFLIFPHIVILNTLYSQGYTIRDIEIDPNGESHKQRNLMQLDDDGFLWYSTHNGLVKDFGNHNVVSSFLDETTNNLPKYIHGFFMDSKQRIWISATTGIFVSSEGLDTSFNRIEFKSFLKGLELQANSFMEDCNGNLWIAAGANGGNIVLKVDPSFKVTEYPIPGIGPRYDESGYFLRGFLHFERRIGCDTFLIRRGRQLFVMDNMGKTTLKADFTATMNYNHANYYHPEWQRNGGDGLLITNNGDVLPKSLETNYRYKGEAFKTHVGEIFQTHFIEDLDIQVLNLPIQEIIPITEEDNPTLKTHADFVGIEDAGKRLSLFKMVEIKGNLHLKKAYEIPFPNVIDDVVIDKRGIIYVSSYDRISKIRFNKNSFEKILDGHNNQKVDVRGFLELPNEEILTATNEGVFTLTPSDGTYGESPFKTAKVFAKKELGFMKSFIKVSDSTAWCVGESKGLIKINFLKNTIEEIHIFDSHLRLASLHYYDILMSSDSTLLLASHYGLHEFNTRQNKFRELPIPIIEDNGELFVWDIHRTKDRLLIGTDASGLLIQDLDSNVFLHFTKDATNNGLTLPSNKVHTIYVDEQENIWVGTDKGATCIDKGLRTLRIIDGKDGLTNLNVVGILEDNNGNMWFSTHNGLYRYGKGSKKVTAFFVEDGLTSNDFNQISYYKSSRGKLFFGGVRGLVAFDTIKDTGQFQELRILPTKFEYYDRDKEKDVQLEILNKGNYSFSLPYAKNSFSIVYSINDCYNTENNKYAYKLDGFTEDWVNLGSQTDLKLLSIPPGDYVLRIKGSNSTGIESANELIYNIHVAQVLYRRPWFQSIAVLSLLALVALVLYYRSQRERKKHELRLTMVELERKALRAQMNPHFMFNALNRIRKTVKEGKLAKLDDYISNFASLMRLTLDVTRNENIRLSEEIRYIENYVALASTKSGHDIGLVVKCGPDIEMQDTFIPSMILQPLVENAIVHGFADDQKRKTIVLAIERSTSTRQLMLTITDDGIGISEAKKNNRNGPGYQSYATQILQERLKLLNQVQKKQFGHEITIKDIGDGRKTGTEVTIKIPY
ncbi:MAG: histidine kinase [Bacteroidota bacterium]